MKETVHIYFDGRKVAEKVFNDPAKADEFMVANVRRKEFDTTANIERTNDDGSAYSRASAKLNERGEVELLGAADTLHSEAVIADPMIVRTTRDTFIVTVSGEQWKLTADELRKLFEEAAAQGFELEAKDGDEAEIKR